MTEFEYVTLDVFTGTRFGGNQLAVILDARGLSSDQMQTIAREFNFSESTFVLPPQNPAHTAQVRIFTPGGELPFAGHPTVGTAFALATLGKVPRGATQIILEEVVGPVPVAITYADGAVTQCTLTAPRNPVEAALDCTPHTMCSVVGAEPAALHRALPVQGFSTGNTTIAVPLATRAALANCALDAVQWKTLSAATRENQYYPCFIDAAVRTAYVRMFVPGHGVMEDAATGSAAASFAGYLAQHIETTDGTYAWTIHQGIEMGRPSKLDVQFDRVGGAAQNVRVGGQAVMVMQGKLWL